ncbi:hypothetical protein MDOR_04790 [Mycolicibacterium doricum]|uniref:Uncharacterized protein n=2 Tax=Mycolicibacterium doricum TaxID=126673 RepID=A0A1X1TB25_9MYCO|nr:hypothetical protein AWC01_09820 [Mycolicibacterium doricum]BBZ06310.1 hypothetical protein MDOR_04790 [Mycolicibacterium doricum]
METVHQDAEDLAETIKRIVDDAATPPAAAIDETTNQVIPPDTTHMTEEYAAQVAAKVTDLQGRIRDDTGIDHLGRKGKQLCEVHKRTQSAN